MSSRGTGARPKSGIRVLRTRGRLVLQIVLFGRDVQASVARCLRTPPYAARRKDLSFGVVTAYAATATGARLSFATVQFRPITVAPSRDKANPFRRSSILFRPPLPANDRAVGGAAGYRPRVRSAYYERVYVHSPEGQIRYRHWVRRMQRRKILEQGFCQFPFGRKLASRDRPRG